MKKLFILFFCGSLLLNFSCSSINDQIIEHQEEEILVDDISDGENNQSKEFKLLSLGDSYTIGQSVCTKCRFPVQLKDSLFKSFKADTILSLKVVARTGWTTTNLIDAIKSESVLEDYNLVTLLIGVNNQYQNKDFSIYETEFPVLVNTSIKAVNGNKNKLIVVSIPDYAFTPFGKGNATISQEIDEYNLFAKNYCLQNGITYLNITDITRQGLVNTALVASDDLHPSELAYTKFVERLLPLTLEKLKN